MLPTITDVAIGEATVPSVSARDLHAFLEVRRDFTTWIKDRLDTYGFSQGIDFVTYQAAPQNGGAGNRGVRTEYAISLDTAKELAMVERTDRGRQARRYFIECERKVKAAAAVLPQTLPEALRLAADLAEANATQAKTIAVLTPRSEALAAIADGEGTFCIRDAAKALQVTETSLRAFMTGNGWLYRREAGGLWIAHSERIRQGYMTTKVIPIDTGTGKPWNRPQARITSRGLTILAMRLGKPVPAEAQLSHTAPAA